MSNFLWRTPCAVAAALLMSGCAGVPLDQGRSNVRQMVESRSSAPTPDDGSARIAGWLGDPLTLETAQYIALLRNPGLQARYARLGLGAADVFEASRWQNPRIGLSWLLPLGAAQGQQFDASASVGFTGLLLRRVRVQITQAGYQALQQEIAASVLELMADTRRAWLECVAANERVAVRRTIADAATLTADLAAQYLQAGNFNQLEFQVQRAEASQAGIELRTAQLVLADARAKLQELLGLDITQADWRVPEALPEVPGASSTPTLEALQALALTQRLDLMAARRQVEAMTLQRGAASRYRLLGDARLGAAFDREPDGARRLGPAVELSLPLFHQGQSAVVRASAEAEIAIAQARQLETRVQGAVRQQWQRLELARLQVESFREALIPQRQAIVARLTEQANFMLTDSFAVLAARQQEYAAWAGYVDALLGYWTAETELLRAIGSQRGLEEGQ